MKSHSIFMWETFQKSRHFMIALHLKSLENMREQFSGFNIYYTSTFPATIYWKWSICLKEEPKTDRPTNKTKKNNKQIFTLALFQTHVLEIMSMCYGSCGWIFVAMFRTNFMTSRAVWLNFCGAFYVLSPWNTKLGIFRSSVFSTAFFPSSVFLTIQPKNRMLSCSAVIFGNLFFVWMFRELRRINFPMQIWWDGFLVYVTRWVCEMMARQTMMCLVISRWFEFSCDKDFITGNFNPFFEHINPKVSIQLFKISSVVRAWFLVFL